MRFRLGGWQLREAQDEAGYTWEAVLIAPGMSKNNVMYAPEVLQAAAPLFEGVRALARSDQAHLWDEDVSAENVCGWFDTVRWIESTGVVGTFHITEDAEWLAKK